MNTIRCNGCCKIINDASDVYHFTGFLRGEINGDIKLCYKCFLKQVKHNANCLIVIDDK